MLHAGSWIRSAVCGCRNFYRVCWGNTLYAGYRIWFIMSRCACQGVYGLIFRDVGLKTAWRVALIAVIYRKNVWDRTMPSGGQFGRKSVILPRSLKIRGLKEEKRMSGRKIIMVLVLPRKRLFYARIFKGSEGYGAKHITPVRGRKPFKSWIIWHFC